MRLTLRTLLSYLDDTLEPAQAKTIGAKVAESEQARELMERIKQVTRRRRLAAPSTTGPGGIDANTIAEYLDNDVTPEQAAELEQICLASDVHLAEVAACHQILTLVLGEPALVPPSAKQRMYGLVKGPESIPFRKPAKPTAKDDQDLSSELEPDADETLRLGVPAVGGTGNRNLWIIAGGGVLAAGLLVVAFWQLLHNTGTHRPSDQVALNEVKDKAPDKDKEKEKDTNKDKTSTPNIDKDKEKPKEKDKDGSKTNDPPSKSDLPITVEPAPKEDKTDIKYETANMQTVPVGYYVMPPFKEPAVLLQQAEKKKTEKPSWVRINDKKAPIVAGRRLVSLSGSKSVIAIDNGVELTLWGNLPEATMMDFTFLESSATLHTNPQLDADLTLERGRIILRNKKPGKDALVRVRFDNPTAQKPTEEYFDITLNGTGAAVIVERSCVLDKNEPFYEEPKDVNRRGPIATMRVFVYQGSASVRFGQRSSETVSENHQPVLQWNSRRGGLGAPEGGMKTPTWFKEMPTLKDEGAKLSRDKAMKAHEALAKLADAKPIDVALAEMQETIQRDFQKETERPKGQMSPDTFAKWRHLLRCREAIDDVSRVYDDFQQEKTPLFIRGICVPLLQQWLAWNRDNDYLLLDTLRDYHTKATVRVKIMELLHPVTDRDAAKPATYQLLIEGLDNDLLPIRTLSHWNLLHLAPMGGDIPYEPALMPRNERMQAMARWRALIPPGQLPPTGPPMKKDKG